MLYELCSSSSDNDFVRGYRGENGRWVYKHVSFSEIKSVKTYLKNFTIKNVFGHECSYEVWVAEINTLEELNAFIKEVQNDIVIGTGYYDGNGKITIYDGYLE